MHVEDTQLKNFILDSNLVSRTDFERAEGVSGKKGKTLSSTLVDMGLMTEDDLGRMHAYILGIPFVNLTGQKIAFEVLSMIPEPIARTHNIVAFGKKGDSLEVAMLDTADLGAIDFVKKKVGLKILARLTDRESIKSALLQYQKSLKMEFGDIIKKASSNIKTVDENDNNGMSEGDLRKIAEDIPVVRIVDTLLKHAIVQGASDIHIEPMEEQVLIRYRIDGILHDAMNLPKNASAGITARIKVLAKLKLDEKRLPQDGRFKVDMESQRVSLRVSVLPTYYGEKVVMRLLRDNVSGFSLEGLGFHGKSLEDIHDATKKKTGLILTTGPTGSGKTTTLYTVLDLLNEPSVNISTIEDPIEYQMQRINQTQVKADIGFTFSQGLRSLLRQDPDVIMVGEIRDKETASLAINASLTGHLVLSTLHTNSAAGAIPRLIDMKAEPFLLVSTIDVILGQRLIRKLCETREKYTLSKDELETLGKVVDLDRMIGLLQAENVIAKTATWNDVVFYKPKPNDTCADGYSGRIGIYEVLKISSAIRELIMQGAATEKYEEQAKKEGMITMIEDGIFKAAQGQTTIEEVLRVVSE
ncbi:hypothetical protein COB55_02645 [Candidatus Wolfebacteria bacterium]|nr:MAG: hypothetical protein COB55_02645 [Candidatus Wolfebacteria bacterium]